MGCSMLNQTVCTEHTRKLVTTLMLQSEWVLYPFLSVSTTTNALCERTFNLGAEDHDTRHLVCVIFDCEVFHQ